MRTVRGAAAPPGLRVLVLGGTRFLGRALVEAARADGHQVTLFNRGRTGPGLFPELETVLGDRTVRIAAPGCEAINRIDITRASAAGLRTRPLPDTVADTASWDTARGGPPPGGEGLRPDEEQHIFSRLTEPRAALAAEQP